MSFSKSNKLYTTACSLMPGGVNSPVRAFKHVESTPFFVDHAKGAYVTDIDGNTYLDFVNSWGSLILGHAHTEVLEAVKTALEKGTSYGIPHPGEIELAQLIQSLVPSMENLRLVSSGTEATMSVIRLARGFTKRKKIIKFEGCYHGASDSLLVKAGSGVLTFGIPDSAGIPDSFAQETLVARYNDLESVANLFEKYPHEIAAVIIEPIAGNMNLILPLPEFLSGLRKLCDQNESLLIFDEVITGFRVGLGGAQALYGVKPDLTTLGKIIGGGFPLAAFGGRRDIMNHIAPLGQVYQAGTLSGNPIATAAGLATLNYLIEHPASYETLEQSTLKLVLGLKEKAQQWSIPFHAVSVGGMFGIFFTHENVMTCYEQVKHTKQNLFKCFFHGMLKQGIYFAPSSFEVGFVSLAHSLNDIEKVIQASESVFSELN